MTRSLPAAVLFDSDPRSVEVANTVPAHAEVQRVADCILGYTKLPASVGGAQGARQKFTLLEMKGRGTRKALRSLVSYRREHGIVIEDDAAWAAIAADIAACIFGPRMTLRHVEGQALYIGVELNGETLAPFTKRAAALRSLPSYEPLTGIEIGKMVKLDWRERDDLTIKQIIAWNESTPERRKRRDRERKANERAARAHLNTKPWEKLGISRATYYRRLETKDVGVPRIEGNAEQNCLTPGNADGFRLTVRPETVSSAIPMGNAEQNRLTSRKGGSK